MTRTLATVLLVITTLSAAAPAGEIGADDFRISDIGTDGQTGWVVNMSAVAYNAINNEYLVVWRAEGEPPAANQEFEIYGQRIDAATGLEVGTNDFRISSQGTNGSSQFSVSSPQVAWNSVANEYLVVWRGTFQNLAIDEFEIYGQRINGATGAEIGGDFRISDMGPDGAWQYRPNNPDVAYNSTNNEWLVVWDGDDNTPPLIDGENEIFGQRISGATGAQIGGDFRISDMGTDGSTAFWASGGRAAYDSTNNEYLVVWSGDDNTPPLVDGELEIFGQRIDASSGSEIGTDFRISHQGPETNTNFEAFQPDVAYNGSDGSYLVAWVGTKTWMDVEDIEYEIFAHRLVLGASPAGGGDFQVSETGPPGESGYDVYDPEIAYNPAYDEFMVVWRATLESKPFNEVEVVGQRLDGATAAEVGADDFRISNVGPDGQLQYTANEPNIAYNDTDNEYLVVWHGDNDTPPQVDNENEIWGQRLGCPWDCSGALDAVTGIVDLLAVLAQWGGVDESCDLDLGAPGIGIDEFLAVLAAWGPCL